jgi:hypothetical protein
MNIISAFCYVIGVLFFIIGFTSKNNVPYIIGIITLILTAASLKEEELRQTGGILLKELFINNSTSDAISNSEI